MKRFANTFGALSAVIAGIVLNILMGDVVAGSVFTCTAQNGAIVFQGTPCADVESVEILRYEADPGYSAPVSARSQSANTRSSLNTHASDERQSHSLDSQAIAMIRSDARAACGRKYMGRSEDSLRRSLKIARKSKAQAGREDAADIGCHLNSLAKIKRINEIGLERAWAEESARQAQALGEPSQPTGSNVARPPSTLLDPFSGTVMPRTGAGYTDPRNGTFYSDTGAGVVNTRTGEFIPTHKQ